jgi:hypothetical protein
MPRPSHSSRFYHPNNIWWAVQIIKLLHSPVTSSLSDPNIFLSTLLSNTLICSKFVTQNLHNYLHRN